MQNPFLDTHADAWGEPVDLPSLHAIVTDDLVRRVDSLSATSQSGVPPRSQCVLLLGPAGSGKTHLFARLRKRLGKRAVFVYLRPEPGSLATPRYLLAQLVDALRRPVPGFARTQLDLIAGTLFCVVEGQSAKYPLTFLQEPQDDPRALVERALEAAEIRYPGLLPKYLERLLLASFERDAATRRAMVAWLSGRPPSEAELTRLGETQGLGDEDILPALRTLGFAATFGAPLMIVYDQLENLAEDDPARPRLLAHAQLITELRDTAPGMLLVQMAIDSEWTRFMEPGLPPQLLSRMQETVHFLKFPSPEQARELVDIHLSRLPAEERKGPFPWPLDADTVRKWTGENMTPRALILRCKSAFDDFVAGSTGTPNTPATEAPTSPDDRLEAIWKELEEKAGIEIDRATYDGHHLDAERIASGLLTVLPLHGTLARLLPARKNRVEIRVSTTPPSIVLIAQQNHHRSFGTLLTEASNLHVERAVLVREEAFPVPATWKQAHAQIASLKSRPNVLFSTVARGELTGWLAAETLLSAARSKDLSDGQGRTIELAVAVEWLRRRFQTARSGFLEVLLGQLPELTSQAPGGVEIAGTTNPPAPIVPLVRVPDESRGPAPTGDTPSPPAVAPTAPVQNKAPSTPAADERSAEADAIEKLVVGQLLKLGVTATVTRRVVGARLIRLEVSTPRQRVADLDRAAADVEHKLADQEVSFGREGPRRFFSAPRSEPRVVRLDDLVKREEAWLRERPGRFVIGERVDGQVVRGDLSDGGSCHLLIAGQTGSGKSVLLRALVVALARLQPPGRIRFTLGDPKRVTFGTIKASLPDHVALSLAYDAETIVARLERLAEDMDARFTLFQKGGVQDIHEHNAFAVEKLPLEVVVIDEFADLVLDKAYKQPFLDAVKRIGNMGRAAGIHMALATQRPDRNTVPGEIKANLVGKVALKVQSALNSRIVLDEAGAEKLLGKGDLLADLGHGVIRAQTAGA